MCESLSSKGAEEEEEEEDKQAGGRKINAMCCDNEPGSMPTGAPLTGVQGLSH